MSAAIGLRARPGDALQDRGWLSTYVEPPSAPGHACTDEKLSPQKHTVQLGEQY